MATVPVSSQVTVEEYEQTSALFDRHEFVHGLLSEKPLPSRKHSLLQGWLSVLFWRSYPSLQAGPEPHCKLGPNLWRIPDFAVQTPDVQANAVYAFAPILLAIEILSPEDRLSDVGVKLREYSDWGVLYCWVFDPENERAWTSGGGNNLREVSGEEVIKAREIEFPLAEIFSVFHRAS